MLHFCVIRRFFGVTSLLESIQCWLGLTLWLPSVGRNKTIVHLFRSKIKVSTIVACLPLDYRSPVRSQLQGGIKPVLRHFIYMLYPYWDIWTNCRGTNNRGSRLNPGTSPKMQSQEDPLWVSSLHRSSSPHNCKGYVRTGVQCKILC